MIHFKEYIAITSKDIVNGQMDNVSGLNISYKCKMTFHLLHIKGVIGLPYVDHTPVRLRSMLS